MNRRLMIVSLFVLIWGNAQAANNTFKGVMIEPKITVNNVKLQLNGFGVREKWFFNLYVARLYLEDLNNNAQSIIKSNSPMVIDLNILSSKITSKRMKSAITDGFKQSTNNNTQPISKEIREFLDTFTDKIVAGDKFRLVYIPGKGTEIYKNNQWLKTIPGLPFKQALFGIWLGPKPADKDLKNALLGK